MKKSATAFDLLASVVEMNTLKGSRVENIYKTASGFLFKFAHGFITATKYRVSLTGVIPEKTHEGTETLRGLFRNEKLINISMPRFDRIIEFEFENTKLIFELVEPFNVIAVRDEKVIWLLHSYRGKDRELRPGLRYVYPPAVFIDVLKTSVEEVAKAIDPSDVKKSLIRRLGTGVELADELIFRWGTDPVKIAEGFLEIISNVLSGRVEPTVCIKGGVAVSVLPIRPISLQCDEYKHFEKFWQALDFYFSPMELQIATDKATQDLQSRRKRLEASISELEKKISEYRAEASRLRSTAHKLLMYKTEIEEVMSGKEGSVRIRYVDKKVEVTLPDGEIVKIEKESVGREITSLFERAKELENKAKRASEVLQKLKEDLSKLDAEIKTVVERVKATRAVEKSWFEKFRWTITTNKRPVVGGRDASQNESIVRKYLKEHYLFFHADIPGASVVVAPPSDDPLELLQIAQFAAAYSRAWRIGIHTVDVYYVKGAQVSKSPPSGQYLAKGSFMVYGRREYVRNVRLELAVGYRRDGDFCRVVAAPPKAAPLLAERYYVLTPGNFEKSKMAKEIVNKWRVCGVDDVVAALPGPSRILEEGRGSPVSWEEVVEIFKSW
ncbi:MAG: ribosome rescue protein RqcH [Pyrobaculum sp.]